MHLQNIVSSFLLLAVAVPAVVASPLDPELLAAKKSSTKKLAITKAHPTTKHHVLPAEHTTTVVKVHTLASAKHTTIKKAPVKHTSTKRHTTARHTTVPAKKPTGKPTSPVKSSTRHTSSTKRATVTPAHSTSEVYKPSISHPSLPPHHSSSSSSHSTIPAAHSSSSSSSTHTLTHTPTITPTPSWGNSTRSTTTTTKSATTTTTTAGYAWPTSFSLQAANSQNKAVDRDFLETGSKYEGFKLGESNAKFTYNSTLKHLYSNNLVLAADASFSPNKIVLVEPSAKDKELTPLSCSASSGGLLSCTDGSMSSFRAYSDGGAYYLSMTSVGGLLNLQVVKD